MEINAENMLFDQLNALVKASSDKKIIIRNVLGQRYIASGAENKEILIYGVAGNALGAYLSNTLVKVYGNAQDAAGDTMNSGSITVFGHAGDTIGYAMRGGTIMVEGDAGFRVGIHMKEYGSHVPKIIIGGKAGDFLGEYQAGGIILVLGIGYENVCPVGAFCATGQYGGKIYIRTRSMPRDLPPQVDVKANADKSEILPLIKEYCSCFGADFNSLSKDEYMLLTPSTSNIYKRLYCNRSM